jgi:hypothetical protein
MTGRKSTAAIAFESNNLTASLPLSSAILELDVLQS